MEEYCAAKDRIISHQKSHQKALLPANVADKFPENDHERYTFSTEKKLNSKAIGHFFLQDSQIVFQKFSEGNYVNILDTLSDKTYPENLLILSAVLTLLGQPMTGLHNALEEFKVIDHRLEKCGEYKGISIYNDSKSTLAPATLAAVDKLAGQPIILFLGGVSKGVDRSALISQLQGKVKTIYCFGKEAEQLHGWCLDQKIPSFCHTTLDEAFAAATKEAQSGDQILLSPGGASFDLFANYQERGDYFKKLVKNLKQ